MGGGFAPPAFADTAGTAEQNATGGNIFLLCEMVKSFIYLTVRRFVLISIDEKAWGF